MSKNYKKIKVLEEYSIVDMGGEYALLPDIKHNKKGLIVNDAAYEIYKEICVKKDVDKVIESINEKYSNEYTEIQKIVYKCIDSFEKAGMILIEKMEE